MIICLRMQPTKSEIHKSFVSPQNNSVLEIHSGLAAEGFIGSHTEANLVGLFSKFIE